MDRLGWRWGSSQALPRIAGQELSQRPKPSIPRVKGHHRDWIDSIKGVSRTPVDFEYGARLTEIVHLGTAAVRFKWHAPLGRRQMSFKDGEKANRLLTEEYRDGWKLKDVG